MKKCCDRIIVASMNNYNDVDVSVTWEDKMRWPAGLTTLGNQEEFFHESLEEKFIGKGITNSVRTLDMIEYTACNIIRNLVSKGLLPTLIS